MQSPGRSPDIFPAHTSGHQVALPDGRHLGYAEFGIPEGQPVFLFHGLPGSRLFRHPDDNLTSSVGVRLITVDRPGFGLSDFQHGRRLLGWPDDIAFLASALGIDRFAVLGFAAGAPYALACTYKIPRRITATGIVSGLAPLDHPAASAGMIRFMRDSYMMARRAPQILRLTMWFGAREAQSYPAKHLARMNDPALCASDRALFADDPAVYGMLLAAITEAFRKNSTPYSEDMIILARTWGFRLSDIMQPVYLWHGEQDVLIPPVMGRRLAQLLPACSARFFPAEGHALLLSHWTEILAALASRR